MKQKMYDLSVLFGIVVTLLLCLPKIYALPSEHVSVRTLNEATNPMITYDVGDKVFIGFKTSASFEPHLLNSIEGGLVYISSMYNTLYISNPNAESWEEELIHTMPNSYNVTLDFRSFQTTGMVKVINESGQYNLDGSMAFDIYYMKDANFSKPSSKLTIDVDVDEPIPLSEINDLFILFDNYDGDISDQLVVETDNYTNNMNVVGAHNVTLRATDSSGNSNTFTYTVRVKDYVAPIVAQLSNKKVSYKNVLDLNDILSSVNATDNYQTNLEISITQDNYSNNKQTLGTHEIQITVDDLNGNQTVVTQKIEVIDDVAPIISGERSYNFEIDDIFSIDQLINNLSAVDEIDSNLGDFFIISSNYEFFKVGSFEIEVGVKDASENLATTTLNIQVVDNIAPEFYIKIPQINVNADEIYRVEDLLTYIEGQLLFNYDHLEINYNEYTQNEATPGVYRVNLTAQTGDQTFRIETFIRVHEAVTNTVLTPQSAWYQNIWVISGMTLGILGALALTVFVLLKRKKIKFID